MEYLWHERSWSWITGLRMIAVRSVVHYLPSSVSKTRVMCLGSVPEDPIFVCKSPQHKKLAIV